MTARRRIPRSLVLAAAATLALGAAACGGKHVTSPVPVAAVPAPPAVSSPAGAMRRMEWSWQHLDLDLLAGLLPADFEFGFAPTDSAGNLMVSPPMDRAAMLGTAGNMFHGGGARPPVLSIALRFDSMLVVQPDPRPGKAAGWHQMIATRMDADLATGDGGRLQVVAEPMNFFLVRGDSAVAAPGLAVADSTRWFVEGWDELPAGIGTRARPAGAGSRVTWGQVLSLYR